MIKIGTPSSPSQVRIDAMRAETERRFALAEMQCAGDLRRLGIKPTGRKIDIYALDKAMSERKLQPGERMRIKQALAAISWLDE